MIALVFLFIDFLSMHFFQSIFVLTVPAYFLYKDQQEIEVYHRVLLALLASIELTFFLHSALHANLVLGVSYAFARTVRALLLGPPIVQHSLAVGLLAVLFSVHRFIALNESNQAFFASKSLILILLSTFFVFVGTLCLMWGVLLATMNGRALKSLLTAK